MANIITTTGADVYDVLDRWLNKNEWTDEEVAENTPSIWRGEGFGTQNQRRQQAVKDAASFREYVKKGMEYSWPTNGNAFRLRDGFDLNAPLTLDLDYLASYNGNWNVFMDKIGGNERNAIATNMRMQARHFSDFIKIFRDFLVKQLPQRELTADNAIDLDAAPEQEKVVADTNVDENGVLDLDAEEVPAKEGGSVQINNNPSAVNAIPNTEPDKKPLQQQVKDAREGLNAGRFVDLSNIGKSGINGLALSTIIAKNALEKTDTADQLQGTLDALKKTEGTIFMNASKEYRKMRAELEKVVKINKALTDYKNAKEGPEKQKLAKKTPLPIELRRAYEALDTAAKAYVAVKKTRLEGVHAANKRDPRGEARYDIVKSLCTITYLPFADRFSKLNEEMTELDREIRAARGIKEPQAAPKQPGVEHEDVKLSK